MINTTRGFMDRVAPQRYRHFMECIGGKWIKVTAIIYPKIERFPGHLEERVVIIDRPGENNQSYVYHDISHNLFLKLIRLNFFRTDHELEY